jgi:hypothetical protein
MGGGTPRTQGVEGGGGKMGRGAGIHVRLIWLNFITFRLFTHPPRGVPGLGARMEDRGWRGRHAELRRYGRGKWRCGGYGHLTVKTVGAGFCLYSCAIFCLIGIEPGGRRASARARGAKGATDGLGLYLAASHCNMNFLSKDQDGFTIELSRRETAGLWQGLAHASPRRAERQVTDECFFYRAHAMREEVEQLRAYLEALAYGASSPPIGSALQSDSATRFAPLLHPVAAARWTGPLKVSIEALDGGTIRLKCSRRAIRVFIRALSEACYGFGLPNWEFPIITGFERSELRVILDQLHAMLTP